MGYGMNLKNYLKEKKISVNQLAELTGISKNSIYTTFKRDTPVRYDYALRISQAIRIPVSDICNTDPYNLGLEMTPDEEEKKKAELEDSLYRSLINRNIVPTLILLGKESVEELQKVQWLLEEYCKMNNTKRDEVMLFMDYISKKK